VINIALLAFGDQIALINANVDPEQALAKHQRVNVFVILDISVQSVISRALLVIMDKIVSYHVELVKMMKFVIRLLDAVMKMMDIVEKLVCFLYL
jgi:hypothetical protein